MTLRARRLLLVAALVLLAATGAGLWLRDSSLVAVREVRITGLDGEHASPARAALAEAAREMTTLHVREDALRAAARPFAVVRDVRADAGLPHSLRIEVEAHPPLAALEVAGQRSAVAADGTVLPETPTAGLPLIDLAVPPAVERVRSGAAARLLAVLAAAPRPLAARAQRAFTDPERGLSVQLREGPRVHFGDGGRPVAGWLAAARVLADQSTEGASYVDVRVPERPAVGGLPPLAEPQELEAQAQVEPYSSP
jgi:cell division protein FtsQ